MVASRIPRFEIRNVIDNESSESERWTVGGCHG